MSRLILVVDDSATVRKFVATALSLKGFRVMTASDGLEALEKMPQETVDLVITDLNMPDMDGFEFIKSLRETSQYQELPIVILSSMTDDRHKNHGLSLGAHSFLEKPFSVEEVQQEVSKLLKIPG